MNDEGTLERNGALSVLRFRRHLAHPPSTVWAALTEDDHLAAWFPTTIEGERVAGAPLRFSFRESEGAPFDGEMTSYDPPKVLELRWGDDILRFELSPQSELGQEGCVLTLTVTFPENGKAARRRSRVARVLGAIGLRVRREHAAVGSGRTLASRAPPLCRAAGARGVGDRTPGGMGAGARR